MPGFEHDLDEREDDDLEHDDDRDAPERYPDEPWLRDRCVIPGTCIVADPYHGPDECHTAEAVEAYERELGGGSEG